MDSFVIDAHLDLPMDIERKRYYGKRNVLNRDYLPRFRKGNVRVVVAAVYLSDSSLPEMALRGALRQISCLKADIQECADNFAFCTCNKGIKAALASGKIAILLSMEDCIPLQNDLDMLPVFYELGVRFMGLAWSRRNYACDGSNLLGGEDPHLGGLTPFGKNLVRQCNQLGIILDVSHINAKGFWDLAEICEKPFIASHSNTQHLQPTGRNLSDEQIRRIAQNGGVIGVNAMGFIISQDRNRRTVAGLCDHIEHLISVCGIDCVGFGFDFNNQLAHYFYTPGLNDEEASEYCDIINGYDEIHLIMEELWNRGVTGENFEKITHGNFMRLYESSL